MLWAVNEANHVPNTGDAVEYLTKARNYAQSIKSPPTKQWLLRGIENQSRNLPKDGPST